MALTIPAWHELTLGDLHVPLFIHHDVLHPIRDNSINHSSLLGSGTVQMDISMLDGHRLRNSNIASCFLFVIALKLTSESLPIVLILPTRYLLHVHGGYCPKASSSLYKATPSSFVWIPYPLAFLGTSCQIGRHLHLLYMINGGMKIRWIDNADPFCDMLMNAPDKLHLCPFLIEGGQLPQESFKASGIAMDRFRLSLLYISQICSLSIHSREASKALLQ